MTTRRIGNAKSVVLCLFLAAGLVFIGGCKKTPRDRAVEQATDRAGEKMFSEMMTKASGGRAKVDLKDGKITVKTAEGESVITSGGGTWPGDLPEEIRQFKAGSLQHTSNTKAEKTNSWLIIFKDVEADAVAAYVEDLKGDGWSVETSMDSPKGNFVQITLAQYLVQLTYTTDEKTLALNFIERKEE